MEHDTSSNQDQSRTTPAPPGLGAYTPSTEGERESEGGGVTVGAKTVGILEGNGVWVLASGSVGDLFAEARAI